MRQFVGYEKKVYTEMVNNSTNINKMNNDLSTQPILSKDVYYNILPFSCLYLIYVILYFK
jgi:hypothetical protein